MVCAIGMDDCMLTSPVDVCFTTRPRCRRDGSSAQLWLPHCWAQVVRRSLVLGLELRVPASCGSWAEWVLFVHEAVASTGQSWLLLCLMLQPDPFDIAKPAHSHSRVSDSEMNFIT